MKKIENKIKNSIELPNLSFFEKLPKIQKQKKHHYVLAFASFLILFTIVIGNMNVNKSLSEQVLEDNINDNIIFNILNLNNDLANTIDTKLELNYGYKTINTKVQDINTYYKININDNNLISSNYVVYDDIKNTICYANLDYKINNKDISVKIANVLGTWNIETYGFINTLYNSDKSLINNKPIILSKYSDNNYPKYVIYEHENNIIYYYALYEKDNLYYYVTSNSISEEEFITFLKEYIV